MIERNFMKVALLSTPVAAIGSGQGGGVELTITLLARELAKLGHQVSIICPAGSVAPGLTLVECPGDLMPSAANETPANHPSHDSVLLSMWNATQAESYDLVMSMSYDYFSFKQQSNLFPICHFVSMAALPGNVAHEVRQISKTEPQRLAFYTKFQAQSFEIKSEVEILAGGVDLKHYKFNSVPTRALLWMGRISPEKGLDHALEVARRTKRQLNVFGIIQDQSYWSSLINLYPELKDNYAGFLQQPELGQRIGQAYAMLMPALWDEAFGNVIIEALACGVPVLAYKRGGISEIIEQGKVGYLVEAGDINQMSDAVALVSQIDRFNCRKLIEEKFSAVSYAKRVESWFYSLLR